MDVESLKGRIPNEVFESLKARGVDRLTPPQESAVEKGLLEFKDMLISSPTASGKTLIAELACMNSIISKGMKAIYIAPMRALASEKFNEFKEFYPYVQSAISIGDLDSNDPWLSKYQMMFFSTEKFDSLLRHGIDWLDHVGCIVFDEIHMLDDSSRGPTLELLMTKLANTCDAQMVALSATIGNPKEIAKWMKAELVTSDYRPVKLMKGVVYDRAIHYYDDERDEVHKRPLLGSAEIPEVRVLQDTLEQKKQMLIFYSTKKNTEVGAARLAPTISERLGREEVERLNELSDDIYNVLERPTEQCMKLATLIKSGVAFHHSGLLNRQRSMIEDAFKQNIIKAICSTTTLGYGVNLPAYTVLVRDTSRFDSNASERIGVNEILQLFGRAGRPKYDKEGRALLIASTEERMADLYKSYILASPDPIDSALGIAPVLRTHILAFVAQNFLNTKTALQKFMEKTFYSFQYGNHRHINNMIDEILDDLKGWEFVNEVEKDTYLATRLGKRVSELYIDPLSAKWIVDSIKQDLDAVGILYMISNTLEMRPYVKLTQEAELEYSVYMHMNRGRLATEFSSMDYGYYDPARAFSTALMMRDWILELKEQEIVKKYSTTPGALYSKITNADWLLYSAVELSNILKKSAKNLIDVRVRVRYGIRDELLDLVRLEQIGRVRARLLYSNGIRKVQDIRDNREQVAKLLGREIAQKVFLQL